VPILIRPCLWEKTPLKTINPLPRDGTFISESAHPESQFLTIAKEIEGSINHLIQLHTQRQVYRNFCMSLLGDRLEPTQRQRAQLKQKATSLGLGSPDTLKIETAVKADKQAELDRQIFDIERYETEVRRIAHQYQGLSSLAAQAALQAIQLDLNLTPHKCREIEAHYLRASCQGNWGRRFAQTFQEKLGGFPAGRPMQVSRRGIAPMFYSMVLLGVGVFIGRSTPLSWPVRPGHELDPSSGLAKAAVAPPMLRPALALAGSWVATSAYSPMLDQAFMVDYEYKDGIVDDALYLCRGMNKDGELLPGKVVSSGQCYLPSYDTRNGKILRRSRGVEAIDHYEVFIPHREVEWFEVKTSTPVDALTVGDASGTVICRAYYDQTTTEGHVRSAKHSGRLDANLNLCIFPWGDTVGYLEDYEVLILKDAG
jgi:hypothetical protein